LFSREWNRFQWSSTDRAPNFLRLFCLRCNFETDFHKTSTDLGMWCNSDLLSKSLSLLSCEQNKPFRRSFLRPFLTQLRPQHIITHNPYHKNMWLVWYFPMSFLRAKLMLQLPFIEFRIMIFFMLFWNPLNPLCSWIGLTCQTTLNNVHIRQISELHK
jgi:hypothetical protein